ncbi:MAG: hypothetical protein ACREMP_02835 [Candidatus Tyrphobacter sp.]
MLHRAFTSSAITSFLIMALGSTVFAAASAPAMPQGQHTWVGANALAPVVSSVHPSYGFSARKWPAGAGGGQPTAPAAGATPALLAQAPAPGAIALSARRHSGAEAIDVTGTAPPGASVEITAVARISIDLPVVFLNRMTAVADASGEFSVEVPIAPDYVQGTVITIAAQTPGVAPASVSVVVGAPSSGPPITSTDVDNDNGR